MDRQLVCTHFMFYSGPFSLNNDFVYINAFYIIVCTILGQHLDEFKDKANEVIWQISSKFNEEMSMMSEIVSKYQLINKDANFNTVVGLLYKIYYLALTFSYDIPTVSTPSNFILHVQANIHQFVSVQTQK